MSQLARTWLQLGIVQAQLERYEDALRSFSLIHTKYWGEKEDQELLNVSAKAWLEKCLVLLQMSKFTESAEALLGTVSKLNGEEEELAYAVCVLERISAICRNKVSFGRRQVMLSVRRQQAIRNKVQR